MQVLVNRNVKGEVTSATIRTDFDIDKNLWKVIQQVPDLRWQLKSGPFLKHRLDLDRSDFNIVIGQYQIKKMQAEKPFPSKNTKHLKGRLFDQAAMIVLYTVGAIHKPRMQEKVLRIMLAEHIKKEPSLYNLLVSKNPRALNEIEVTLKYLQSQINACDENFQNLTRVLFRKAKKLLEAENA